MKKRLTKLGKNKQPELINPMHRERAITLLSEYEDIGLTPDEVAVLAETANNLTERIKRLEDWT